MELKPINKVKYRPVFIVGMCPGKQRKGSKPLVFTGNRTGDFIQEIIKDVDNVYLTNIFNEYIEGEITEEVIKIGSEELRDDILRLKPCKIICLGEFAFKHVHKILIGIDPKPMIIKMKHPSYILRFNKDRNIYKQELINYLIK